MARDGTQTYILPFPDVVADTTIESTVYNGFTHDVAQDLNTPRPIVAGGTGASSASAARVSLGTEAASQVVTNYNSFVFEAGSFYSAAGATGAPTANAFSGICYKTDANNIVIEARDSTTGLVYVRRRIAGVWNTFGVDDQFVQVAGDIMTGNLQFNKADPSIILNKNVSTQGNFIYGMTAASNRWVMRLGDTGAEAGADAGSDFVLSRYSDAGALLSHPFTITRSTGLAAFGNGLAAPIIIQGTSSAQHVFTTTGTPGTYAATYSLDATGLKIGNNSASRDLQLQTNSTTRLTISAAGGVTFSSTITGTAKGHLLGAASGTLASGAVANTDANILLYNSSSTNWAGVGSDTSGNMWFKTGTSGTPVPQMYIASNGNIIVSTLIAVPTPAAGDNSTTVPTTAWVRGFAQPVDAQLFSNIPQNSQAANYTCVAADAQKHIYHDTADNNPRTYTIPANASVAYPLGTCITFINRINTVTIAINSDTLIMAAAGSTGSRTLAVNGIATAIKFAPTAWMISGSGLS